jgi:nitroimidazol reductase NimA-like FMN-containing flavoprotein (pyridoxamine 5'-phosphate oxidase superfamily)
MTRTAPSGLELLEAHECYAVIGAQGVGRVDVARHGLPAPVPLAYVVDGADLLLSTREHPGLLEALDGAVAAVEVDVPDEVSGGSWRVVLVGPATGERLLVRVRPTDVTGYRLPSPTSR